LVCPHFIVSIIRTFLDLKIHAVEKYMLLYHN
jgi:hypothetical protein